MFFVNFYYYSPPRVPHRMTIKVNDKDVTPQKPAHHLDKAKEEVGYVMATHYSDQMTGSAANVVSLQCWASTLGTDVRVVEPFVRHSRLGVNLHAACNASAPETENNSVRLRDVFDINEWERKTKSLTPIVTWDHFINYSKRKLIVIDRECPNKKCMDCDQQFVNSSKEFADRLNFTIVRRICFPRKVLAESVFKKLVYADNSPRDVTVIFNSWGGVAHGDLVWRVGISGSHVNKCQRGGCFYYNPVSKTIVDDAQTYLQKYMPASKGNKYISVMIRLEHFKINHKSFRGLSVDQASNLILKCFNVLVNRLNELKKQYSVVEVFVTSDCSKHGSAAFQKFHTPMNQMMIKDTSELYDHIYNGSSNFDNRDELFHRSSSFTTPGYIAMLHKHVAASGTCLITVGGGMFQSTARQLHSTYHPSGPKCALTLPQC